MFCCKRSVFLLLLLMFVLFFVYFLCSLSPFHLRGVDVNSENIHYTHIHSIEYASEIHYQKQRKRERKHESVFVCGVNKNISLARPLSNANLGCLYMFDCWLSLLLLWLFYIGVWSFSMCEQFSLSLSLIYAVTANDLRFRHMEYFSKCISISQWISWTQTREIRYQ